MGLIHRLRPGVGMMWRCCSVQPVAKMAHHKIGVIGKPATGVTVPPSAGIGMTPRQIPVIERGEGLQSTLHICSVVVNKALQRYSGSSLETDGGVGPLDAKHDQIAGG